MSKLSDEMKKLVERQRLGFIATVCPDGTPNLSPKGTLRVLDDDHLIFADLRSPGTISNLRTNPNVEVNVVDHFVRKGYRFKGTAHVLEAGAEFAHHIEFFSTLGLSDAPKRVRAIVIIHVDQARPLTSPAYDHDADEVSVREYWLKYYASHSGER
jgi:predicted pyridoxine 5'-phosphate oxidase superfamily flavin-nucleotide-binding protein